MVNLWYTMTQGWQHPQEAKLLERKNTKKKEITKETKNNRLTKWLSEL